MNANGTQFVHQGCTIDNVFSPTDHVISLNTKCNANLSVIIGPQASMEAQISNHFDKMNDNGPQGDQSTPKQAQNSLDQVMTATEQQAGSQTLLSQSDAGSKMEHATAASTIVSSKEASSKSKVPNGTMHLYTVSPVPTCIRYQIVN